MKLAILHSEAESELREATAYYEECREGLGREFRLEVEASIRRIRKNAESFWYLRRSRYWFAAFLTQFGWPPWRIRNASQDIGRIARGTDVPWIDRAIVRT